MLKVEKHSIILSPTEREFENKAVINPGIFQDGDTLHFLYRAVQEEGLSSIGYAKTDNPLKIAERMEQSLLSREYDFEQYGLEDAKIVKIENTYYITYIAYDGMNKTGALATSKDLIHFEKHGIITPRISYHDYECLINLHKKNLNPKYHTFYNLFTEIGLENDPIRFLRFRALVLFPRKINGKFALLISIYPGIQIVYFDAFTDLTEAFWENYFDNLIDSIVMDPKDSYEVNYIGIGCVPIETNEGWLLIYYGVQETITGVKNHVKAALLDLENPKMILSRLNIPLFSPKKLLKEKTHLIDVVFPTGHALLGNTLYIYYGMANKFIAVASLDINELLLELRNEKNNIVAEKS